jgi:cell division protein FtsW
MTTRGVGPAPGARYLLLATTIFLALGGLLMVFSASAWTDFSELGNSYYHLGRQALSLTAGFVLLLVCRTLPVKFVRAMSWFVLVLGDVLLALVLTSLGAAKYGAVRAIDLGIVTLQPADIAKIGCVLVVAGIMAERTRGAAGSWRIDLAKGAAAVAVPFVLIMMQPDVGVALSLAITVCIVLAVGGLRWRWFAASAVAGGLALPVLVQMNPHVGARIATYMNPGVDLQGRGYQAQQALVAIGSGGWFGLGLGMSRMKAYGLPAVYTDFIFAIIAEELGLIGCTAVVVAFGLFGYAGFRLALSVKDDYARLVASGLTGMIVAQALINMASVTGLMPVAGEPLPLVSYGGSSLVLTLGCIGLILGMTRQRMAAEGVRRVRKP